MYGGEEVQFQSTIAVQFPVAVPLAFCAFPQTQCVCRWEAGEGSHPCHYTCDSCWLVVVSVQFPRPTVQLVMTRTAVQREKMGKSMKLNQTFIKPSALNIQQVN